MMDSTLKSFFQVELIYFNGIKKIWAFSINKPLGFRVSMTFPENNNF